MPKPWFSPRKSAQPAPEPENSLGEAETSTPSAERSSARKPEELRIGPDLESAEARALAYAGLEEDEAIEYLGLLADVAERVPPKYQSKPSLTDTAVVVPMARKLQTSPMNLTRKINHGEQIVVSHDRFLAEHGIRKGTFRDEMEYRRFVAEVALSIPKERERMAARRARGHMPRRLEQEYELREAQLEELENEHHALFHPSVVGSPYGGGSYVASALDGDGIPGNRRYCSWCQSEISGEQAFDQAGKCDLCWATATHTIGENDDRLE